MFIVIFPCINLLFLHLALNASDLTAVTLFSCWNATLISVVFCFCVLNCSLASVLGAYNYPVFRAVQCRVNFMHTHYAIIVC